MIRQIELDTLAERVGEHLFGHILPFWSGPALDRQQGGWMGWLTNDLQPDRARPKGLIVNSRILWAFSAAYRSRPEPLHREMADRAYDHVMNRFWDRQHGGAYWRLDDQGRVINDSKKTYGQAFYIYGLTEYHRAFNSPVALDRARELFRLLELNAHDEKFGGYFEVCNHDWTQADANARLSEKDMNEKKSMNNHLHVLEAYTNLYRVWREPLIAGRLEELIDIFLTRILDGRTNHFHHFFDEAWQVRSDTYTFGHDIEGSWLLCEAAAELGDAALLESVQSVALQIAKTAFDEGLGVDGGLYYEGKDGKIVDSGRECWPQAEAMVGFLNAFQISRDEKFLNAAFQVWNFISHYLADRVHGEWFWRILADGKPDPTLPKVSEWKGPYHGTRACLETLHRLKTIKTTGEPVRG
ncbi:MAG: AGE family epimerase/isomerase [Verrucomicrobiota bacterium]|jgi:mannobiose 2-epimerase